MQNFSTVAKVKKEAGFDANENIENSIIQTYLNEATAVVQSYVAKKYNLAAIIASTFFAGSQSEFYLKQCEELYAAGSLLNKEYGYQNLGESNGSGDAKIKQALDLLQNIIDNVVILMDINGVEFTASTTASRLRLKGFPNSNVATSPEGKDLSRKFSMGDSIT